jgi:phosphate transport system substrate-binding protein
MFIVLPLSLSGILILPFLGGLAGLLFVVPFFLCLTYLIYRFGKKATLPDTFVSRYGPFITPILFSLVVWLLIASLNSGDFSEEYGLLVFLPFFVFLFVAVFMGSYWFLPVSAIVSYLFFGACFAAGTWRSGRFRTTENKWVLPMLTLVLALASAATVQGYVQYHSVLRLDPDHPDLREDRLSQGDYTPFSAQTKLVSPGKVPSLQIDRDYPKLDGAVALVPVYAAAANAIYRKSETQDGGDDKDRKKAVGLSKTTPAAYKALLDGQVDMIFASTPSEEQKKEAAEKGINYSLTPIGKEAFVFLVNEQNPVTGLSVEQIRDIYSGKINDWKEIGGAPGKIMAFQRNEGSGSQTAMLRIMRETPMRKPLKAEYQRSMGGLLRDVANYRNLGNAIGYSFRYYATIMNSIPGIRLLPINGVAPTEENIRNGSYPFTGDFYIVTARPLSENAAKLRDWFLSDEGQQFIAEVGYAPLRGR